MESGTLLYELTVETPDISKYLDFGFYDRVWFKEDAGLVDTKLGRFLRVSHHIGSLMSYWIFPASGIPMSSITVQRFTNLESQTEQCKKFLRCKIDPLQTDLMRYTLKVTSLTTQTTNPT